ncbi:uncharacterized protein HGUI_00592 [Hanseniaspora guilliermondii]|uniref:Uncharacterized protein n=1 Tax=Hanseniaspora guilliermondii TaxID=56406 RepID=A0A1L0AW96_9ASCO|nr:uncharacterized protein HGUI_00592 [Hanseniaspora guilliermondii]
MNSSFLFLVHIDDYQRKLLKTNDFKFEQFKRLLPSSNDFEKLDSFKHKDNKITFILNKLLCLKAVNLFVENDEIEFISNKNGKPMLKDNPKVKFNMSNCISENITTMIINNHGVDVGIDIANVNDHMGNDQHFDHTLYKDILSNTEMDLLSKQSFENKIKLFAMIWSIKESYTKLIGVGLSHTNLANVSVFSKESVLNFDKQEYLNIKIDQDEVDFNVFWCGHQVISVCQRSFTSISLPLMIREISLDKLTSSCPLSIMASSSFNLKKHSNYFSHYLGYLPASAISYDPNRFTIIYYSLLSKYLLSQSIESSNAYIDYIKDLYVENDEFCGFTPNKNRFYKGIDHNIPQNFFAILNLLLLGCRDFQFVNVLKISNQIKQYLFTSCNDVRDFYMGLGILYILDTIDELDLQKTIESIEIGCFINYYGFTNFKKGDVHSGYISCIANIFQILKLKFGYCINKHMKKFTFDWLCHRQVYIHKDPKYNGNGGFNGRENKKVDSCYAFWNLSAMNYFQESQTPVYNMDMYNNYILKLQDPIKGGFAKHLVEDDDDDHLDSDVYHSFTTLCAIGLVDGILDSTLCLPKSTFVSIIKKEIKY